MLLGLGREILLVLILLLGYLVHAEDSVSSCSSDLDDHCGVFCYKLFKPVLMDTVEFREQIDEYREKYHDVGEKIERMQQNATRQENVINYQTEQIVKLNLKVAKYEETIRNKESELRILIEINDKYKLENEEKGNKIKYLETKLEEINKKNQAEQGQNQSRIKALESEVEKINNKYKEENEKKDIRIKLLGSEIEEINKKSKEERDNRDSQIRKLQSELNAKNTLLESSQKQITLLANQSETSAREINVKNSEITSLKTDLGSRDAQISEYRQKEGKCSAESCLAFANSTGLHTIQIPGLEPFVAPCNSSIAGPGWMVIQRRIDGSVDFNRTWQDYKHGFGDVSRDFWLGLERLHKLTTSRRYELYVQVTDLTDNVLYERYDNFEIESEAEQYKLSSIGKYTGTAGDQLSYYHEGMKFTTVDRGNDERRSANSAIILTGGWWFKYDVFSNLNAQFGVGELTNAYKFIWWGQRLKSAQMLIRPWLG